MLLGILAVNLDLPLCVFLLDASETNYSGFRGAIDQARQRWREIQSWMMGSFHGPVYEWKVRQWAVTDSALRKAVERADSLRDSLAAAASWCRQTLRQSRFEFIPIVPLARTGHIHLGHMRRFAKRRRPPPTTVQNGSQLRAQVAHTSRKIAGGHSSQRRVVPMTRGV